MPHVAVHHRTGSGPPAVFLHANGIPPRAYLPFLDALGTGLDVHALATRSLVAETPPPPDLPWAQLGHDALDFARSTFDEPVVAIGHSMGGTGWIEAVAANPNAVRALVLIEPAMVRPWQATALRWLPRTLGQRLTPAGPTRRKRDRWDDEAAFRASATRSGLYEGLSPEAFEAFVAAAIRPPDDAPQSDERTLVFPKVWEAHWFDIPPNPWPAMAKVSVPVVAVRGRSSIFLDDVRWEGLLRGAPHAVRHQLVDHGHLLPLEAPAPTAQLVLDGLRTAVAR